MHRILQLGSSVGHALFEKWLSQGGNWNYFFNQMWIQYGQVQLEAILTEKQNYAVSFCWD